MRAVIKLFFFFTLLPGMLVAQMTQSFDNELLEYNRGLELYEKQKFGAAKDQFEKSVERFDNQHSEISANADFYIAACALKLFHKDSEFLLKEFVRNYSASPRVQDAWLLIGNYNYRKKKWEKAIHYYDQLSIPDLVEPMLSEYLFKMGYAHFQEEQLDEAADLFFQMKDQSSVYYAPGVYYLAHINYSREKYATALKGFQSLEGHPQFGDVVPYYIVQVLHYQKEFDQLVSYGQKFLGNKDVKRRAEISRLVGDALFNQQAYAEAIPFLSDFMSSRYSKQKEDYYTLGYAYYKNEQFEDAAEQFSKISYNEDATGQNAQYHLGESYLRAGKKSYARNAYRAATRMDFDADIKEDALYKFALLSYELSYDPYDGAIAAFKEYIAEYPDRERTKEAYDYLVNIYLTSKNYDAALASIDEYEDPDIRLKEAYQRIAFNKGVTLFQERLFVDALSYLDRSLKFDYSKTVTAKATYWKAECHYYRGDYAKAVKTYEEFIYSPGAVLTPYFNLANYNVGYAYFQQDKFIEAPSWFRRFVGFKKEQDEAKLSDANLRIGDCYFMLNQYDAAFEYYVYASEIGKSDPDYAMYQVAMTQGLLKKLSDKLTSLQNLVSAYPNSHYLDAAHYEIGRVHIAQGRDQYALTSLQMVVDDFPGSSYVRKALVSIGQTHYNGQQDEKALEVFLKIVREYPTYEDTREALIGVQNIYTDQGHVDKYEELISSLDFVNISDMALDSINYEAAEIQYFNGQCKEAVTAFNKYLDRFGKGIFSLNARYYRAECLSRMGQDVKAAVDYEYVADLPRNKFSEPALVKAARTSYADSKYPQALGYYKRLSLLGQYKNNLLESEIGQMRCNFILKNYQGAIANGIIAQESEKLDHNLRVETDITIAKSNLALNSPGAASSYLSQVILSGSPSQAAEATYLMAKMEFDSDMLDTSEVMVFSLVEAYQSESFWLGKGLLLLSDIYMTRGDLFQAKATLQNIVDNYEEEDEVKAEAEEKIITIEELELLEEAVEMPDLEIPFNAEDTVSEEIIPIDSLNNE
ncbi:MAG: tetratricopeptide repeat protein [Flavobacteriales bacterium]|nr:tetratricopeptide repeat protein [Flavobacteriales bacterium]MBT3962873.1 tetratricopeptide repeat protein [Flavobacteriales bacterium]MBT4704701.1 tetratricopeptide repeat protein [Flavobacteriales bacterium]MBT4931716.1 tetratricopeptide repeat protein [Flavobacteriales bacterium]MBT5133682.1 tetratricopeptide repeat protein [Flavobacteriales bacterium]